MNFFFVSYTLKLSIFNLFRSTLVTVSQKIKKTYVLTNSLFCNKITLWDFFENKSKLSQTQFLKYLFCWILVDKNRISIWYNGVNEQHHQRAGTDRPLEQVPGLSSRIRSCSDLPMSGRSPPLQTLSRTTDWMSDLSQTSCIDSMSDCWKVVEHHPNDFNYFETSRSWLKCPWTRLRWFPWLWKYRI
jgi:hypothetical protein